MSFDVQKIRKDFPNLATQVHGRPLVYLDNAATTFKPQVVIDAITNHYARSTSNVHRGVHTLSEQATKQFEDSREKVQQFLNASSLREIIFTRGTTESINLISQSYGKNFLKEGDEILISEMEHHSNIVPWQMLCEQVGCRLKVAPINDKGELIFDEFKKLLSPTTKIVSVVYVSNSLGTVNPIEEIIEEAHGVNAVVIVDGAQAVSHTSIDVQHLGCDFFVFSAHKLFGPTGVGVLYGKESLLDNMPPVQGGGDMIASVTFEKTIYNGLPYKLEAGTPHVAGVIGLGAAIDYITALGLDQIKAHKQDLLDYATKALGDVSSLRIIGTAKEKTSIVSFILPDIHAHDIGTLVDQEGVAIRTGHHCTQPIMQHFKVPATSRASMTLYNTKEEIDILVNALEKTKDVFK